MNLPMVNEKLYFLRDGLCVSYKGERHNNMFVVYPIIDLYGRDRVDNLSPIFTNTIYEMPRNYYRKIYADGRKCNLKDGMYLIDNLLTPPYQLKPVTQKIIDKYITDPSSGIF